MSYVAPSAQERLAMLRDARTIAIVGMSADPSKASSFVATYLLSSSCSYEHVWFVNPRGGEILGRPVHRSLAELPAAPDIVDVFRRSDDLPAVAEEVVALGRVNVFWAQLGLRSERAAEIVETAGGRAVMDRCIKIEHARFRGGLHFAGFDTGRISSRRQPELG
jgi:uncharacterized protein